MPAASATWLRPARASMKVPPKRKGNVKVVGGESQRVSASMKVPPKRKGNRGFQTGALFPHERLNESPSEKEGKYTVQPWIPAIVAASMKVPPKRKGNLFLCSVIPQRYRASMKVPPKRKGNDARGHPQSVAESPQ